MRWTNTTGKALVPPTPQVYTHDLDGNLTADGLWTRTWNAENRVLTVESVSALPADAKKREVWTYLPDGRWIERIVSTNNGSAYYPALTNRYVWDGQVLLAVLDHANGLVMSFVRGMDLSGSVQGAGGVGGVLAVSFAASTLNPQPSTHFVSYDGNGNVVGLSDAATGASTARYEYGPFGELQRSSGPMANIMPLRFSTMYSDDVTGEIKYLFRDYRAEGGRWPSRDPIGEEGGVNVYGFVQNDAINFADSLGLITYDVQVFDTGLQTSTSEVGSAIDYTAFSMPPTESCKWGFGNKYKTLDIKVKIGVYYRKPSDKKLKMQSGRAVEAHEKAHVDYYKKKWAGTENIVNQYGKLCFCKYQCRKLRDDLMARGAELWDWWAESQHTLLDYTDYPPDEKAEKKRQYDLAVTISKNVRAEYDTLKKQFDKDCK